MNENDTDLIRYIYDEMDPTERMMFERKLERDENLLIEVETLKHTSGKLSDLPEVSPPDFLIQNIVQLSGSKGGSGFSFSYTLMAAMVLFTFSASYLMLDTENRFSFLGAFDNASQEQLDGVAKSSTGALPEMQPWVDYNEVLYLDQGSATASKQDSMFRQLQPSMGPVPGTMRDRFFNSDVVLTGSSN